jgi:hypothetical protein
MSYNCPYCGNKLTYMEAKWGASLIQNKLGYRDQHAGAEVVASGAEGWQMVLNRGSKAECIKLGMYLAESTSDQNFTERLIEYINQE